MDVVDSALNEHLVVGSWSEQGALERTHYQYTLQKVTGIGTAYHFQATIYDGPSLRAVILEISGHTQGDLLHQCHHS